MGSAQSISEAVSNTVTNSVTNVLVNNSASCGQNNSAAQTLTFKNIDAGNCNVDFTNISQQTAQTPNFSCSSESTSNSELQTALKTALQQAAKSELSGLSGAIVSNSLSTTVSNVVNNISTNINMSNTSSCVQNNLTTQEQVYQNIKEGCPKSCSATSDISKLTPAQILAMNQLCTINFNNISQTMTQAAVAKCLSNNKAIQEAVAQISTEVKQEATAVNSGISVAASGGASICCFIILSSLASSAYSVYGPG